MNATFLRSKVARRVFTLFVISALAPTVTLALISFRQVNTQINEQISRQLHTESKLLGMAILERLAFLDNQLRSVAEQLKRDLALRGNPDLDRYREMLVASFRDLRYAQSPAKSSSTPTAGEKVAAFTAGERQHLQSGRTLMTTMIDGVDAPHILFTRQLEPDVPEMGLIVGEIRQEYLFRFEGMDDRVFCLLDAFGRFFACPVETGARLREQAPRALADGNSGWFDWQSSEETFRAGYWKAFLRPTFYTPPWTVILSEPRAGVVAQADEFKALFPPIIGLSLLIVSFLSVTQIRRYLVPLERLREAAGRVANKDFANSLVTVRSGDEFEDLAEAFNAMAIRLGKQFGTLSAMAEIDRSILSTLDANYVIETLLRRIHEVVSCEAVCIGVLGIRQLDQTRVHVWGQRCSTHTVLVEMAASELEALEKETAIYVSDINNGLPSYLAPLAAQGLKHFLVLPIRVQDRLAAVIGLGHAEVSVLDEDEWMRARELADRAAVALSNAAWQEKLYHQAHYDALTDLPNRVLLRDRLQQALVCAEREGTHVAVFFVDVDRFKQVNDSLGHAVGDQLLVQVAESLSACVRGSDTVVRLGGDEFTVVLADLPAGEGVFLPVTTLAQEILAAVAIPFTIATQEVLVTVSVGIAISPRDGARVDELMRNADSAMYHAKAQGRNNYQFYFRHFNEKTLQRLTLETKLRRALERKEFRLHYQPQFSRHSGVLVGAEALLRWQHPELGMISPEEFIPLAEETGLIVPIGEWVIRTASAQCQRWQNQRPEPLRVAVNVSARHFCHADLVNQVDRALVVTGLAPHCLELEVTESVAMGDPKKAVATLHRLQALGVHLSLDDFGTGYSSLSYLHQLPLHALKIDQSFVRRLPQSASAVATVKAIIALAHGLNLSVIAEGVETAEQFDFLNQEMCDEFQGFFFSEPLPAEEFAVRFLPDRLSPIAQSSSAR
ncbi:MAG: putative bifunctional diguanylate cyclase/phosphodiesterase [Gammaproteobacteria bacterium]